MSSVFKSIKLDNYILKPYYKSLIVLYAIAAIIGILAKVPAITVAVVMIITPPFIGTYFSVYEKNNLDKLYGVLPLGKFEVVVGRYLYALFLGIINGIIAGIIAYIISLFVGNGMSFLVYLNYLSISFLCFCLFIGILFPIYFKYPFSKVYIFANLPIYICAVIGMYVLKKTDIVKYLGLIIKYFSIHQYMIWITGLGLGLFLLFISFLISYAVSMEDQMPNLPSIKSEKRLFFVDNLRSALIILVVLHHLSVVYAANTPFYYVEPSHNTSATIILVLFQLFNQAFFIGFFFLLSGYFTPGSFNRKGPGSFLKDRLLRLGIPIIVFIFILNPIASIGIYQMPASLTGITTPFTWNQYFNLIGMGPIWFVVMLLVFDLGYLVWRMAIRNRAERSESENHSPLTFRTVGIFILALAAVSYLLRIAIPFSKYVLGFPSLAYLSQYLSFFLIGIVAYRRNWLQRIPGSLGMLGFVLAVVSTIILFPIAIIGSGAAFLGGGHWQSGIYALWDSIFSVGVCLASITFFRRYFDHQKKLGWFLSRQSFTVYIIHAPIIVFLAIAIRGIHIGQLLKFGLAAVIGVPLCFGVAYLVRKIPYVKKIL